MSDLDRDRADLNALIREAHETIKDLNTAIKMADKVLSQMQEAHDNVVQRIKDAVDLEVRTFVELSVQSHMESYEEAMRNHTIKAVERVYARFDALEQRLIGDLDEAAIKEAIRLKGILDSKGIRP